LRILDDAYACVPQAAMEQAAKRGTELHKLCLSYLASQGGMCHEPLEIPKEYDAAYLAFVKWVIAFNVQPVAVEQYSISDKYGYGGTPDALVVYAGMQNETLIDLKFTASILRINLVQIQAYWRLPLYATAQRALLVHINPVSGELKQVTVKKDPRDWSAFLNALSIYKWRLS
jgi:hypothetical protein